MRKALLTAKEIVKSYPGAQEPVLNHISTEIYQGDFTIIMGPSGAGKSTLLYALSGMDALSSGKVLYQGQELGTLSEKKMAALRAREFGFVFQQTHLVSNLTLFENVAVAGYLEKGQSEKAVNERAESLLTQMHVEEAKDRLPSQASGGEAQRAAIARAKPFRFRNHVGSHIHPIHGNTGHSQIIEISDGCVALDGLLHLAGGCFPHRLGSDVQIGGVKGVH